MKQSIGSGRGSVYNIIMKALQSGDKYGYEICQEVETQTNGKYILKQPSLYSGLKRLEAQKLVESYWGDSDIGGRRHYYKLTDAGRKKIESTNFSWEDERENIVDNFFKKSELDENIDEIKQSIDQTKVDVNSVIETNEQISTIINSDNSQRNENEFAHKVNENQYDLFSYSTNSNDSQSSSLFDFMKPQEEATNQPTLQDKNEQLKIIQENNAEETKVEEAIVQEKQEDIALVQETTPEPTRIFDYNSFFENKKKNSFSENKEEFTPSPQKFEDLQSSNTFYGSNTNENEQISFNDNFDQKYAEFQAMLSKQENIDSSPKQVIEQVKTEPIKEENPATNDNEEQIRLEQERRMSDILSGNFTQNQEELTMTFDSDKVNQEEVPNSQSDSPAILQTPKEEVKDNNQLENINFKSIFGDLYDDREQQEKIETERQKFLDTYFAEKPKENEFQELEQNLRISEETSKNNELPRYDMSDNINYSLKPSDDYTPRKVQSSVEQKPEQPTMQTYNTPLHDSAEFNTKNNVSFDKKCESRGYNFNDYEIRYLRQNNLDSKLTKFVKINKLHLFSNMIVGILALVISLIFCFAVPQSHNHIQNLFYILDFVLVSLYLVYNLITYLNDPNKRGIFKYSNKKIWLNLFVSIICLTAIVCFNIFVLNIKVNNVLNFSASIILPCVNVILCFIDPILTILLHKFQFTTK